MSDSFVTPWTVAHQAPLSMGFPRQDTGMGCRFSLQGIFPTQEFNLPLLLSCNGKVDSLPLVPYGKTKQSINQSKYSNQIFISVWLIALGSHHWRPSVDSTTCPSSLFHCGTGTRNGMLPLMLFATPC